jgi:hypothetical protein
MTTFDLAEVRSFATDLEARMNRCDNGEGLECSNLDDTLRHYATLCCEFREHVRQWGRAVFAGRAAFDPKVEEIWLDEGVRLYSRAVDMLSYGEQAEDGPCFVLDGNAALRSALLGLYQLLKGWVTPKLAVGPSARRGLVLSPDTAAEVRRRIDALPPLSATWQPANARQQRQFKKLRRRQTP